MKIEDLHLLFLKSSGICTDTRKVNANTLFFALKGENFNGNTFAKDAIKNGASFAVIDDKKFHTHQKTILVKNVLKTLQELANYHRNYLKLPIIALTGSNGKTTTKELINDVLSKKYKTVATVGNLNNHIGVPLTLLAMSSDTEIGIVEMGANHLKEIKSLCKIAEPDFGYITNFGKAHLEGFGSMEGVVKGKTELYDYLIDANQYIFLNSDDTIQKKKLSHYIKKIGYSQSDAEYYNIAFVEANPFVKIEVEDIEIASNLIGSYNFTNIAAAVLIGKYFNIDLKAIKAAIESYIPTNNRSQIIEKGSNKIILDAYNANPTSMKAALESLNNQTASKKVVILGDMFELGKDSLSEHQNIIDFLQTLSIDDIFLVGEIFYSTTSNDLKRFKTFEDFKANFQGQAQENATILIKGSRGMALERTLQLL